MTKEKLDQILTRCMDGMSPSEFKLMQAFITAMRQRWAEAVIVDAGTKPMFDAAMKMLRLAHAQRRDVLDRALLKFAAVQLPPEGMSYADAMKLAGVLEQVQGKPGLVLDDWAALYKGPNPELAKMCQHMLGADCEAVMAWSARVYENLYKVVYMERLSADEAEKAGAGRIGTQLMDMLRNLVKAGFDGLVFDGEVERDMSTHAALGVGLAVVKAGLMDASHVIHTLLVTDTACALRGIEAVTAAVEHADPEQGEDALEELLPDVVLASFKFGLVLNLDDIGDSRPEAGCGCPGCWALRVRGVPEVPAKPDKAPKKGKAKGKADPDLPPELRELLEGMGVDIDGAEPQRLSDEQGRAVLQALLDGRGPGEVTMRSQELKDRTVHLIKVKL